MADKALDARRKFYNKEIRGKVFFNKSRPNELYMFGFIKKNGRVMINKLGSDYFSNNELDAVIRKLNSGRWVIKKPNLDTTNFLSNCCGVLVKTDNGEDYICVSCKEHCHTYNDDDDLPF